MRDQMVDTQIQNIVETIKTRTRTIMSFKIVIKAAVLIKILIRPEFGGAIGIALFLAQAFFRCICCISGIHYA
jgi:hypothetical protein